MNNYTHTYDVQPAIEYGFKAFNKYQWCNSWVDSYNNLTRDINKSSNFPVKSDSLTQKERDFFLDQRHKLFVMFVDILRGE